MAQEVKQRRGYKYFDSGSSQEATNETVAQTSKPSSFRDVDLQPRSSTSPLRSRISNESGMSNLRVSVGSQEAAQQQAQEKLIQAWLEKTMKVKFQERLTFYENLESGETLCSLIYDLFVKGTEAENTKKILDISLVKKKLYRGYNVTELTPEYVRSAKSNIGLFLSACKAIGMTTFFTFEDLYLSKNKKGILACLTQLYELVPETHLPGALTKQQPVLEEEDDLDDDEVVVEDEEDEGEVSEDIEPAVSQLRDNRRVTIRESSTGSQRKSSPLRHLRLKSADTPKLSRVGSNLFVSQELTSPLSPPSATLPIEGASAPVLTSDEESEATPSENLDDKEDDLRSSTWFEDPKQASLANILQILVSVSVLPIVIIYVMVMKLKGTKP